MREKLENQREYEIYPCLNILEYSASDRNGNINLKGRKNGNIKIIAADIGNHRS